MDIQQIKDKYDNGRSYENARSKLKRVNTLLNLEPVYSIHTDQYVAQFDNMAHLLMTQQGVGGGVVKSKDELTALIGAISGIVSRSLPVGQVNPLTKLITGLKASDIPNQKPIVVAEPWDSVLTKINNVLSNSTNPFAKIVAICYKHGYVLRIGEIFNTSISKADNFHHLDLDNLEWYLVGHKDTRKFTVTKQFADELRPLLSGKCPLLIFKSTLQPYTVQTHAALGLGDIPSNVEIRNSYQDWNWHKSGRTYDEKKYWAMNMMGHSEMTVLMYNNQVEQKPVLSLKEQIANRKPGDPKIKVTIRKRTE